MTCLNDYIGISGCGATSPASGLFINSLPGISIKAVTQLADAEQATYLGVWSDVQVRAQARLAMDIRSRLSKRYKIKTATNSVQIDPRYSSAGWSVITGTSLNHYYGIMVDLDKGLDSNYAGSQLEGIYINRIYFPDLAGGAINYDVILMDHDKSSIIASASNLTTGYYDVNQFLAVRKLFIGIRSNNGKYYNAAFDSNVTDCGCMDIKGYSFDGSSTYTELGDYSYGIRVAINTRCDIEGLICQMKDVFTYAYWYLLGSEMMMERITSDRINKYTIDRKQAEELKAHYDSEYEKAIGQAVDGISLNLNDSCIECDPIYGVREAYL
jgi:hypothetical protein